ncbi:MAG TPA: lysylphosphatidylglycerol synthase transmembrane domain-containing protein [Thermomicrobiales bacterium]|nr:lysylphosphatidylglycerol synthase transmembrane domain-containing protein [Thermomicrobiales bacterium]
MRRLVFFIIVIAAVIAIARFVDFGTFWSAITGVSAETVIIVIVLMTISAIVKGLRWAFYLRAAKLDISWRDGMTSYLAGMSAGALPGGSWLPARLAQEHGNVRMREAAAGLFVGFVADTIGISLLAYVGMLLVHQPGGRFALPIFGLVIAAILIAMGRSERVWQFIARLLSRSRLTRGWIPKEEDIQQRVSALMRASVIARGVGFCVTTTLLAVAMFYVLANALTFTGISLRDALFVHAVSESAAMVIPIPGGYGVSDSSMAGLMGSLGIGFVRATFVILAIRSFDLLFKTLVGSVILVIFYRRLLASVLKVRRRASVAWRYGRRLTWQGLRLTGFGYLLRLRRRRRALLNPAPEAAKVHLRQRHAPPAGPEVLPNPAPHPPAQHED